MDAALYLIPSLLGETGLIDFSLPAEVRAVISRLDEFIVENEKSARQFLKKAGIPRPLSEIILHPLNQHTDPTVLPSYLNSLEQGRSIGVISEAGCPGVADPGAEIVAIAQRKGFRVIPLVGPSSILLSLMASGFNGQQFTFNGYLPRERADRIRMIKELNRLARKGVTQIFIETPYRNNHLVEDLLQQCDPSTLLCVAADITLPTESIVTKPLSAWKRSVPDLSKRPAIFLIHG